MAYYRIRVRQDAWINHDGVVEAAGIFEAVQAALDAWKGYRSDITLVEDGSSGFDHAECVADDCEEITAEQFAEERAVFAKASGGSHDKRVADRIDGYDRDDLGESPDY